MGMEFFISPIATDWQLEKTSVIVYNQITQIDPRKYGVPEG